MHSIFTLSYGFMSYFSVNQLKYYVARCLDWSSTHFIRGRLAHQQCKINSLYSPFGNHRFGQLLYRIYDLPLFSVLFSLCLLASKEGFNGRIFLKRDLVCSIQYISDWAHYDCSTASAYSLLGSKGAAKQSLWSMKSEYNLVNTIEIIYR